MQLKVLNGSCCSTSKLCCNFVNVIVIWHLSITTSRKQSVTLPKSFKQISATTQRKSSYVTGFNENVIKFYSCCIVGLVMFQAYEFLNNWQFYPDYLFISLVC